MWQIIVISETVWLQKNETKIITITRQERKFLKQRDKFETENRAQDQRVSKQRGDRER